MFIPSNLTNRTRWSIVIFVMAVVLAIFVIAGNATAHADDIVGDDGGSTEQSYNGFTFVSFCANVLLDNSGGDAQVIVDTSNGSYLLMPGAQREVEYAADGTLWIHAYAADGREALTGTAVRPTKYCTPADAPAFEMRRTCQNAGGQNTGNVPLTVEHDGTVYPLMPGESWSHAYRDGAVVFRVFFETRLVFDGNVEVPAGCDPVIVPQNPTVRFVGQADCDGLISGNGTLRRDGVEGEFTWAVNGMLRPAVIGAGGTFGVTGVTPPLNLRVFGPYGELTRGIVVDISEPEACVAEPPVPPTTEAPTTTVPESTDSGTDAKIDGLAGSYGGCVDNGLYRVEIQLSGVNMATALWVEFSGQSIALKPGQTRHSLTMTRDPGMVKWQVNDGDAFEDDMYDLAFTGYVSCSAPTTVPDEIGHPATYELPSTGSSSTSIIVMASAVLGLGLALMGLRRRPKAV